MQYKYLYIDDESNETLDSSEETSDSSDEATEAEAGEEIPDVGLRTGGAVNAGQNRKRGHTRGYSDRQHQS